MALDAKEVQRRGEDLQKAAAANEAASVILPMLAALRAGVRASEDLLRSTRIGVTVNNLRKNANAEVAREATELVGRWRNEIKKSGGGTAAKKGADGASTPVTGGAGTGSKQQTPAKDSNGTKKEPENNASKVEPDKRTTVTDKVDTKKTGDSARDACIKLMYDGLAFMQTESPSHILPLAQAVEKAAFDSLAHDGNPGKTYKEKMRSLYQNLRNKTSPHLRVGILATPPTISPHRLVRMTPDELKSPERRAEDAKIEKENMDKAMVAQEEKSISSSLQCGRCKQRKVSYSQAQTRSADEPMTTFCECTVCGNRWKFS